MIFRTNEPVPEILRNALNKVLEKHDYAVIAAKDSRVSETTVAKLLDGSNVTENNITTVYEIMQYGMARCEKIAEMYIRLKDIINMYNTEAV